MIVPVTLTVAVVVAVGARGTGVTEGAIAAGVLTAGVLTAGVGELTGAGELGASVGWGCAVGAGPVLQASDAMIKPKRAINAKGDTQRLEGIGTSSNRRNELSLG